MMNTQAVVHIRKGEARSLKAGGMWIYDNEIERIEGEFENGDILRVEDFDGYPLGCGFINTRSKLTVRMLSRKKGYCHRRCFYRNARPQCLGIPPSDS